MKATTCCGEITTVPFPEIPARVYEIEVEKLADQYLERILQYNCRTVIIQGEFTFTYNLVKLLEVKQIPVLATCSERSVEEIFNSDGLNSKKVNFRFVRFRKCT